MLALFSIALVLAADSTPVQRADTIRLEVGSKEVDGRVYAPHAARVRVRVGEGEGRVTAEWTNELTHGDSAGRAVHRWVTKGTQFAANGSTSTWEIRQTFDAVTLAPLGYDRSSSAGALMRLSIDGRRVRGTRKGPGDAPVEQVDMVVERPGFMAAASDLVPMAVGLKQGSVMIAPVWGPQMANSELRIFSVIGKVDVDVEGTKVNAWKVEERRYPDRSLYANWYLLDVSPYMVYGEVMLPNGQVQRMSEVELPPKREAEKAARYRRLTTVPAFRARSSGSADLSCGSLDLSYGSGVVEFLDGV
ncbi:MAG: hypothetical protein ACT4P7_10325 [Gemmatimonadaceae bacterium]